MLLLEYVKTVCFLTSEQAGAQISAAFGVSPEGKADRANLGLGSHPGRAPSRGTAPLGPRLSSLGLRAWVVPKDCSNSEDGAGI